MVSGSICQKALLNMEIPIFSLAQAAESCTERFVVAFNKAIGLRVIGCRKVMLDLPFLEKGGDYFILEFQTIVRLQMSRASVSAINVTVNEVCNFFSSLLSEWSCFWPSCESFDCYGNVAISSCAERERSH